MAMPESSAFPAADQDEVRRVLDAERAARERLTDGRREAERVIEAAREQVRAIEARARHRIDRVRRAGEAMLAEQLAELESEERRLERELSSASAKEVESSNSLRAVALELLGLGDDGDGP